MILAGIPYKMDGHTIEATKLLRRGDTIHANVFLLDGVHPKFGDVMPRWLCIFLGVGV